jgi:hypothetical protein
MRTVVVVLLAAALGVSSAFLVACGDRNALLPPGDAEAMRSDLDQASALYAREECRASERAVGRAQDRAQALPPEVDRDLSATLEANLDVVLEKIRTRCGKTASTQTTQTTATQTTQTTETTQTTTTEPPPTTTTTEPPPTTTTTEPPPEGPGESGGLSPEEGD